MEDFEKIDETNISKINSAGLINLRIHNLWVERHKHARNGQYSRWNDDLDSIWCELAADVKEGSEIEKEYQKLTIEYAKACKDNPITVGFNKINKEHKSSAVNQKIALINKEVFLRRLQTNQGKGTAYKDEDDFD